MKHKFLSAFLCVGLLIPMTAIAPSTKVTAQQEQQEVRLGLIFPVEQLDPPFIGNSSEALIVEQLFLGLTGVREDGNTVPELARSWEVSDDGLRWTFFLQEGIPWVDSSRNPIRDVNAQDVAFSIERARETGNFEGAIEGVEVVDEYTIMFFLTGPILNFATILAVSPAGKVVPPEIVQDAPDTWTQPGEIWSAGPYLLIERAGPSVLLAANPHWPGEERIQARSAWVEFTPEPTESLRRYLRGEFDLIELNPDFRDVIAHEPALAEQIRDMEGTGLDLFSDAPFARLPGMGHSYLVRPLLLPVFSEFFGLGGFHLWRFDTRVPEVQIPGTTRVLNDETLSVMESMTEDQSRLVFGRMTPQLSLIFIDDIIVGGSTLERGNEAAPFGFLRRVVDMFSDGSGRFVIETVPAALDEAIERGGQAVNIPIDFGDIYREETLPVSVRPQKEEIVPVSYVPPYAGLKVTIDEVIFDEDSDKKNTTNDQVRVRGWVNVAPGASFQLRLDIKNHQLKSFHFSSTMQESARVELYSNVNVLSFEKSVELKRFTFMPQTIFIGPVPVVITPQLSVYLGASGSVSVGITTGIDQSSTITISASYDNGKRDSNFDINGSHISPLKTEFKQSAKAGVFAGPQLSVMIYGVAGPYGKITDYLTLSGGPAATPLWKLAGGINGELGVKVQVLSVLIVSYTIPITILPEQVLAQAGGGIPTPTKISLATTLTSSTPDGNGNGDWCFWGILVLLFLSWLSTRGKDSTAKDK